MKRQFILFFLFVFPFALQADRYTDMAAKHLEWVKAGQADSLLAHADAQLRAVLPASSIRTIWGQLTAQTGALKNQHEWKREHKDGLELATCLLEFEKARVDYRAVFNAQGQLSGISFTPAPLTASPNMQPEVPVKPLPDDVKEQDFTIKHNGVSLPGKLMMPCKTQAQTQWPVVILVHGSGPQDMDETLGPNKPFRDLAIALAQRGIATVRYDKRTKVYAQRTAEVSKGILNYDTETVDDALQALRQAARLPQIDTDRIYVLGHSMGGTLMPRIALRSELKIAGLIGMAAACRSSVRRNALRPSKIPFNPRRTFSRFGSSSCPLLCKTNDRRFSARVQSHAKELRPPASSKETQKQTDALSARHSRLSSD